MADKKLTYDYTHVIPVVCEKCGNKQNVTKRICSEKTLLNEPVKPEYDIEHYVQDVKTLDDYNEDERERIEEEVKTKKPEDTVVPDDPKDNGDDEDDDEGEGEPKDSKDPPKEPTGDEGSDVIGKEIEKQRQEE